MDRGGPRCEAYVDAGAMGFEGSDEHDTTLNGENETRLFDSQILNSASRDMRI
jgi:hypothetical protein